DPNSIQRLYLPQVLKEAKLLLAVDCREVTDIPRAECEALAALYLSTDGPHWASKLNWLDLPTACKWIGIACDAGHVSFITLEHLGLKGSLPTNITNLTQLKGLDLAANSSITITPELGQLVTLQSLNLSWINLNEIPSELANLTNLQTLSLAG